MTNSIHQLTQDPIKHPIKHSIKHSIKYSIKYGGLIVTMIAGLWGCGSGGNGTGASQSVTPAKNQQLSESLATIGEHHQVPALAGIFISEGTVREADVWGARKSDGPNEVTLSDQWHIGSISKSMTATLAARLIEEGLLTWQTTIGEVFPEWLPAINPYFHRVTIEALLSHTGGTLADISQLAGWDSYFHHDGLMMEQRQQMSLSILERQPDNQIGRFVYSNGGYVVAGAMLERLTGEPWESLIEHYVFFPLEIFDGGFGAPGDNDTVLQPRGHRLQGGHWQPLLPENPYADNPAALGPAGTIHMSLASLAKYAQVHLEGELIAGDFLSPASFAKLHQPIGKNGYALGWFVDNGALFHDGSNTYWYAKVGLDVGQQIAAIAVTNAGGEQGNAATDNVINTLLARYQNVQ